MQSSLETEHQGAIEVERDVVGCIDRFNQQISEVKGRKQYDKVSIDRLYSEKGMILNKIQSIWDKND